MVYIFPFLMVCRMLCVFLIFSSGFFDKMTRSALFPIVIPYPSFFRNLLPLYPDVCSACAGVNPALTNCSNSLWSDGPG